MKSSLESYRGMLTDHFSLRRTLVGATYRRGNSNRRAPLVELTSDVTSQLAKVLSAHVRRRLRIRSHVCLFYAINDRKECSYPPSGHDL